MFSDTSAKLLILAPQKTLDRFTFRALAKFFLRSLERAGVGWTYVSPLTNLERLRLSAYNALFLWGWGFHEIPASEQQLYWVKARALVANFQERHAVLVPACGLDLKSHMECVEAWQARNIPTLQAKRVKSYKDIDFSYPVVIRKDGVHLGKRLHKVDRLADAVELFKREPDLDMASAFVDTRGPDGLYRKYRSIVIGDRVFPRQVQASSSWNVHLGSVTPDLYDLNIKENQAFRGVPDSHAEILVEACKTIGFDYGAIDYALKPDGSIVIFEANRNFGLAGIGSLSSSVQFRQTTGVTEEELCIQYQEMTDALARLCLGRIQAEAPEHVVHLYWTGGYDSTFRLCQLLHDGAMVQPVYLASAIDHRQSVPNELMAMQRLAATILAKWPECRLLPVKVVGQWNPGDAGKWAQEGGDAFVSIPKDKTITEMAKRLNYGGASTNPLGYQYEPLCRFAAQYGSPIELCCEIGGKLEKLLRDVVTSMGDNYGLGEGLSPAQVDLAMFQSLRFPLIRSTKEDMARIAEELGFGDILAQTWSCWHPRGPGSPCGKCPMCRDRAAHGIPPSPDMPPAAMEEIYGETLFSREAIQGRLSIVFNVRNRSKQLASYQGKVYTITPFPDVIKTLIKATPGLHRSLEVIVVDWQSTDWPLEEWLPAALGNIPHQIIKVSKRVFNRGEGRNLGAAASTGEVLYFQDCDVTIHSGEFLELGFQQAKEGKVYAPICWAPISPEPNNQGYWRDSACGCFFIHRDTYKTVGAWRTEGRWRGALLQHWGGEDREYLARAEKKKVEVMRARVSGVKHLWHPVEVAWKDKEIPGGRTTPAVSGSEKKAELVPEPAKLRRWTRHDLEARAQARLQSGKLADGPAPPRSWTVCSTMTPDRWEFPLPDAAGSLRLVPRFLVSLAQVAAGGRVGRLELVLSVWNGSVEMWRTRVREFMDYLGYALPITIVGVSGPFSRGRGLNVAAVAATGDSLFFLDSDVLVSEALFQAANREIAGARTFFPIVWKCGAEGQSGALEIYGYGNVAISQSAYKEIGPWVESVQWGGEDDDYWERARQSRFATVGYAVSGFYHQWHPPAPRHERTTADSTLPMQPLRILYVATERPGYGGAATEAYYTIKRLRELGHQATGLFIDKWAGLPEDAHDPLQLGDIRRADWADRDQPDHYTGEFDIILAKNHFASRLARGARQDLPIVFVTSGISTLCTARYPEISYDPKNLVSFPRPDRNFDVLAVRTSDFVITHSDMEHEIWLRALPLELRERILGTPIHLPDLALYGCPGIAVEYYHRRKYDLGFFASNWRREMKGPELMRALCQEWSGKVKIVATGLYPGLSADTTVDCQGLLPHQQLLELLGNTKLVVVPSRYDPSPNLIAEAIHLGCNVICATAAVGWTKEHPKALSYAPGDVSGANQVIAHGLTLDGQLGYRIPDPGGAANLLVERLYQAVEIYRWRKKQ